jgi:hypothetical protein
MLYTYQDLLAVGDYEKDRVQFVRNVIEHHKKSDAYKTAYIADQNDRHKNVTISEYQKLLYTATGKVVPDNYNANYKMACRHFHRFVTQENQFLLGNGCTWDNPEVTKSLETKQYRFDAQLQKAGKKALVQGESFGFYDKDHLQVFSLLDFAPLVDEEDGALKAGVRFWRLSKEKPLRATLYEPDGYTHIKWTNDKDYEIVQDKTPYVFTYRETKADGVFERVPHTYDRLPIIPLYGNPEEQSEIVGLREQIDCYDLIKSGFANTVDEASYIYWTIQNAGGMDDVDLAKFVEKLRTVHAAVVEDDGAKAESHQIETPFQSREALLARLDKDMYRDAMALDTEHIASGAVTATQINAAYEPLNSKADDYEYCIRNFIDSLLDLIGVESNYTFTRSMIANKSEEIQAITLSASYLDADYIVRKLLDAFGDGDLADDMLKKMDADELNRFGLGGDNNGEPEPTGATGEGDN